MYLNLSNSFYHLWAVPVCPNSVHQQHNGMQKCYFYVLAWACLDAVQTHFLLCNLISTTCVWAHAVFRLDAHSADSHPPSDPYTSTHDGINRRGNNATVRRSRGTFDLTFGFVVSKLMVGEAKPSLLEVFHSKAVSPLCSLYHKSERENEREKFRLKLWQISSCFTENV